MGIGRQNTLGQTSDALVTALGAAISRLERCQGTHQQLSMHGEALQHQNEPQQSQRNAARNIHGLSQAARMTPERQPTREERTHRTLPMDGQMDEQYNRSQAEWNDRALTHETATLRMQQQLDDHRPNENRQTPATLLQNQVPQKEQRPLPPQLAPRNNDMQQRANPPSPPRPDIEGNQSTRQWGMNPAQPPPIPPLRSNFADRRPMNAANSPTYLTSPPVVGPVLHLHHPHINHGEEMWGYGRRDFNRQLRPAAIQGHRSAPSTSQDYGDGIRGGQRRKPGNENHAVHRLLN